MNEKTPESHECKRQRRLQNQREQRRTRLACEKKEQRPRRLQLSEGFNLKTSWTKSSRAEETSQEAQKRLKAHLQRGASRRQYQTSEQTARSLLDVSEGKDSPPWKWFYKNNNNDATSDKSTYTTRNFVIQDYVNNDEQGLNVKSCSQTLISGFNTRAFRFSVVGRILSAARQTHRFDVLTVMQILWIVLLKSILCCLC